MHLKPLLKVSPERIVFVHNLFSIFLEPLAVIAQPIITECKPKIIQLVTSNFKQCGSVIQSKCDCASLRRSLKLEFVVYALEPTVQM